MHDCLVLGGGVIGLSLAYELATQGLRVVLIDRGDPGREASWAGAGIVSPKPFRVGDSPIDRLTGLSYQLHRQWADDLRELTGIDNGYRRCGGIYVAQTSTDHDALRKTVNLWKKYELSYEMLSSDALQQLEPALYRKRLATKKPFLTAYLLPGESQIRSPRHIKALQVACLLRGVDIRRGVLAHDFAIRNQRIHEVVTSTGRLTAGYVCITAGCWSGSLTARLNRNLEIRPVRGQIVLFASPQPQIKRIINEGLRYLVPRPDGRLLVGSTEEEVGFDSRSTTGGVRKLLDFALKLAPELADASIERTWAGLRPATADGRPYLGRLPGVDNALVATGHFRSGLALAPATAVVMRELLCGKTPTVDLKSFSHDPS